MLRVYAYVSGAAGLVLGAWFVSQVVRDVAAGVPIGERVWLGALGVFFIAVGAWRLRTARNVKLDARALRSSLARGQKRG